MNITQITDDMIGKKVSCSIYNKVSKEGIITKENNKYFICQNKSDGVICSDKRNYKYSWMVNTGSLIDLNNEGVCNLKLLEKEEEIKQLPIFN